MPAPTDKRRAFAPFAEDVGHPLKIATASVAFPVAITGRLRPLGPADFLRHGRLRLPRTDRFVVLRVFAELLAIFYHNHVSDVSVAGFCNGGCVPFVARHYGTIAPLLVVPYRYSERQPKHASRPRHGKRSRIRRPTLASPRHFEELTNGTRSGRSHLPPA